MDLTVIIPARNEERAIAGCLSALRPQIGPGVEVIVADDGSSDGTAGGAAACLPGARILRLTPRGSAAARAAALEVARGRRIAFLDADCVPDAGWLDAARRGEGIVMGRVRPAPCFRARLLHLLDFGEFLEDAPRELRNFALLNVAGPVAAFRLVTLPDVPHAHDRLWSSRLLRAGHRIRFDPAQSALHVPPLDARSLLRRHLSYARRFVAARRLDPLLPGARLLALGPVGAPLVAAGRLWRDLGRLVRARRALGIGRSLPLYAAALAACRLIDAFAIARECLRRRGREAAAGMAL
jgi:glycosyltransferase involved in cell wall biosynthesis